MFIFTGYLMDFPVFAFIFFNWLFYLFSFTECFLHKPSPGFSMGHPCLIYFFIPLGSLFLRFIAYERKEILLFRFNNSFIFLTTVYYALFLCFYYFLLYRQFFIKAYDVLKYKYIINLLLVLF